VVQQVKFYCSTTQPGLLLGLPTSSLPVASHVCTIRKENVFTAPQLTKQHGTEPSLSSLYLFSKSQKSFWNVKIHHCDSKSLSSIQEAHT